MNQEDIQQLIDRYLRGACTAEEARIVNSYFNQAAADAPELEVVGDLLKRKRRVWRNIPAVRSVSTRTNRSFVRYLSAAAAVALVVLGWWLIDLPKTDESGGLVERGGDVAPGKYGATLILTDGRTISLDSSKQGTVFAESLTYEDGSRVTDMDASFLGAVESITATTGKGQVYAFTLPDGSKVWLNADSRLTFPSRFAGQERRVTLEGEGYFEIREQDAGSEYGKVPFVVSTAGQVIVVTGTKFNVAAYLDGFDLRTTLIEGAVHVNDRPLVPGQQIILSTGGSGAMRVENADIDQVLAWQQGDFVFRGETLEEVFRSVARWYNIEVRYAREDLKSITVGGTVSRSRSLRAVLDLMESTGKVNFEISGNVITVR